MPLSKKRKPKKLKRPEALPMAIPPGVRLAITPVIGAAGRVPKAAQPWPQEPTFMHVYVRSELEGGFASKVEADAYLAQYMPLGQLPRFPPATRPWHQAQELAYQGWEKNSAQDRATAAHQALQVSPDAADGYLLLAYDAPSWPEAETLCAQAVAAGERLMGDDFLKAFRGKFWGINITRPYLRARFAVGYCLWRQEKRDQAAAHFRELIRLNPRDNQGVRYALVAVLLESGQDREAQQVMAQFAGDVACYWAYNHALLAFRRQGDQPTAQSLLQQARRRNPRVPAFLGGERQPPHHELKFVEVGEESEAIEYLQLCGHAWAMTSGALDWLKSR